MNDSKTLITPENIMNILLDQNNEGLLKENDFERKINSLKSHYPFTDDFEIETKLIDWYANQGPEGLVLKTPNLKLQSYQKSRLTEQLSKNSYNFLINSLKTIDDMMRIKYAGASWRMLATFPHQAILKAHCANQEFNSDFLDEYSSGHCTGEKQARFYVDLARKFVENALKDDISLGKIPVFEQDIFSNYYKAISQVASRLK